MPMGLGRVAATVNALANHDKAEEDDNEFGGDPTAPAASGAEDHATWRTLREALEVEGLGQYVAIMEEHGYDDLAVLKKAKRVDVNEMIANVGMKLGHALTFRVKILERTVRGDITRRKKRSGPEVKKWPEPDLPIRVAHMAKCWVYVSLVLLVLALLLGIVCESELSGKSSTTAVLFGFNKSTGATFVDEEFFKLGAHESYFASCFWHSAIVMAMLIPLAAVRLWNKSVQEVISLLTYVILGCVIISNMFYFASTTQEANEFMRQVQAVTDDEFHADGSPIVMHWTDIAEAGHWYQWMRNVIGGALFAGQSNLEGGGGAFLPGMDVVTMSNVRDGNNPAPTNGVTIITPHACSVKQLRVKTVKCEDEPEHWCIPKFHKDTEERVARTSLVERYYPSDYLNEADAMVESADYKGGLSGIDYPGEGGFAPAVTTVSLSPHGYMIMEGKTPALETKLYASGFWPGYWALCGTKRYSDCVGDGRGTTNIYSATSFAADVTRLENAKWIDGKTSMVHLTCKFVNRNINMNATIRYVVEFTQSGLTRPYAPFITVAHNRNANEFNPSVDLSIVFIFGLWELMESLMIESYDDNLTRGPGHGALREGWKWWLPTIPKLRIVNVLDGLTVGLSMTIYFFACAVSWYRPNHARPFSGCIYSMAFYMSEQQLYYGFLLLVMSLKVVFLCDSIPYLNIIGRTLGQSVLPVGMFAVIFMIIMYGFSFLFYIVYNASVEQFQTISHTFFALFRGMVGDIPLDDMMFAKPMLTPFLFGGFCFITLFTVLTILIAVISDAYAAVQDDSDGQILDEDDAGGIAVILRCVLGFTGHYTPPLPENDEGDAQGNSDAAPTAIDQASAFSDEASTSDVNPVAKDDDIESASGVPNATDIEMITAPVGIIDGEGPTIEPYQGAV